MTFRSNIIICQKRLIKNKNSHIVFPSEIDSEWLENIQISVLDKARLLYVGRFKVEKGIFSLLKMFDEIAVDIHLSIVGDAEGKNLNNKKISYIGHGYDSKELIKIYDRHNIFVLPSFTEAHPKVIDESLSRGRPVIIFEEIEHIIQDRKGIFVSKRNAKSFLETIDFIMKNYTQIQESMKKNKLPTKKDFILQMSNILGSN
jgi:glycosyltransferase involved in cell wall biosynthesis